MVEEAVVAVGRGVVKLVNDDDVERVAANLAIRLWSDWIIAKTWRPLGGPAAAVDLAEVAAAQHGPIRRERLPEDLLAVGHEQQRQSP